MHKTNVIFFPSKKQAKKWRFVKYERKEAVKETKEKKRERERNSKNLKVFFPSSNTAGHESEVEERKEDKRIINVYGCSPVCIEVSAEALASLSLLSSPFFNDS